MIERWNSPYQTSVYAEGLEAAGVPVEVLNTPDGNIYFSDGPDAKTAWELDSRFCLDALDHTGRAIYRHRKTISVSPDIDAYYTLALNLEDINVANRFMRNVRKARADMPNSRLEIAETEHQLTAIINSFGAYEERRDGIAMDEFTRRIKSLSEAGALLAYALIDGDVMKGAVCVLKSQTQANLRYYTSERGDGAGHLLHYSVIENLFANRGLDVVDLSGISPSSDDKKLKGIDEFKQQLGGTIIEFERSRRQEHA